VEGDGYFASPVGRRNAAYNPLRVGVYKQQNDTVILNFIVIIRLCVNYRDDRTAKRKVDGMFGKYAPNYVFILINPAGLKV
jgi:hypothetical protein